MTDLIAALTLLGAPAAALFALRCTVQHQFRRERGEHPGSWTAAPQHARATKSPRAL
ncbi:hypothetical protein AB4Z39_30530 [Mycobacterium adipatum]|jgi:hypothetical protein|uniref:hypothetical protein n=1 Tax=Mycobacterium adipatum TaxID=1682113 RepID=UPI0034E08B73